MSKRPAYKSWFGLKWNWLIPSPENQAKIRAGLDFITGKVSCVAFIDLDQEIYTKADYIFFAADGGNSGKSGIGCWSFLGRQGGQQTINLGDDECFELAKVVHEVLHGLAFVHEQSRPDRDEFIKVNMDMVQPTYASNFATRDWLEVDTHQSYYDFSSVLHYPYNAFAKTRDQATIEAVHRGDEDSLYEGVNLDSPLSAADVVELSLAYHCPITNAAMVDYVNHNRKMLANRVTPECCVEDDQLVVAVQQGDLVRVKNLLKYVDPNSPKTAVNGDIAYPLHEAAIKGHDEIVRVLIASGADVNLELKNSYEIFPGWPGRGSTCDTPLHLAVRNRHLSTVRILVSNGAIPSMSRGVQGRDEECTATWDALLFRSRSRSRDDEMMAIFKYLVGESLIVMNRK